MSDKEREKKSVVIIGGGYAGVALARALDKYAHVTLVDRHESFFHKVASLRAAVDPAWTEAPFISYRKLLRHGTIACGPAVGIDTGKREVHLTECAPVRYDIAVIATGSDYADPANFAGKDMCEAEEVFHSRQEQIADAKRILIIGGGPVGVELVGEISARYPKKDLIVVQNVDVLLAGDHTKELGIRAQKMLESKGVKVLLNETLTPGTEKGVYTKMSGEQISADLVFVTIGAKVNTAWLAESHANWLDERGRVKVDPYLRVEGETDLFAIGDVTNIVEPKLALSAVAQARLTTSNILALLYGKQTLETYVPFTGREMVVPIGPRGGVTVLPFGRDGMVFGSLVTWFLKSRTLLIPKYRRLLRFFSIGIL